MPVEKEVLTSRCVPSFQVEHKVGMHYVQSIIGESYEIRRSYQSIVEGVRTVKCPEVAS